MQEYIAIASGVAGAVAVSFKVLKWGYTTVQDVQRKLDSIAELSKELVPNGGTSLRDSVNRMEECVVALTSKMRMIVELNEWEAFESDRHGNWTCCTGNLERVTGLDNDEMLGYGWVNAIHPADRSRVVEEYKEALAQERDWICSFGLKHIGNGMTSEYRIRAHALRRNGQMFGYLGLIERDYSEEETLD